jgi:hypothetical protein
MLETLKGWRTIVCVVLAGVAAGLKAIKTQAGLGDVPDEVFDGAVQVLLGGGAAFFAAKIGRLEQALKDRLPFMLMLGCLSALALGACGCWAAPEPVVRGHDTAAELVAKSTKMHQQTVTGLAEVLRQERRDRAEDAMAATFNSVRLEAARSSGKVDAGTVTKDLQAINDGQDAVLVAITDKWQVEAAKGGGLVNFAAFLRDLETYAAARNAQIEDVKTKLAAEAAKPTGQINAEEAIKYIADAVKSRDAQLAAIEAIIGKFAKASAAADRESALALELMGELRKYDATGTDAGQVADEIGTYIPGMFGN